MAIAMAASGFVFATTYLREFLLPHTPLALWGDQVGFFNDGSRIAAGQLPYRDYFKFLPPATDLLYAVLIKGFGLRIWIPNLLMAVTAGVVAFLVTRISQHLMRGSTALLPAGLLSGFVLLFANDPTHHWFSTIAALGAILCLLESTTTRRVFLAGICCGIAACFTQTKGLLLLAGIAVYLCCVATEDEVRAERLRKCLLFVGVAVAVFSLVNAPFIAVAGGKRWFYCLVEFPLRYYPVPRVNNWRVLTFDFHEHAGSLRWIVFPFLFSSVPLAYVWATFTALRGTSCREDRRKLLLIAIAGLGMLLAIVAAPSVKRIATVSPPAMILLAWLLDAPGAVRRRTKISLATAAILLSIALPLHVQRQAHFLIDVPSGRVALTDRALFDEYAWFRHHTQPGEYCFGLAPLYYTFRLRNPAPIEGYDTTDYTRPEQVQALVESLEAHRTPMIVLRGSAQLLKSTGLPSDHLGPFRAYLLTNYEVTKRFDTGDDVWERSMQTLKRRAFLSIAVSSPATPRR